MLSYLLDFLFKSNLILLISIFLFEVSFWRAIAQTHVMEGSTGESEGFCSVKTFNMKRKIRKSLGSLYS